MHSPPVSMISATANRRLPIPSIRALASALLTLILEGGSFVRFQRDCKHCETTQKNYGMTYSQVHAGCNQGVDYASEQRLDLEYDME